MDWIIDHLQIIIFLAVVIGPLLKQLAEAAKTKRETQRQRDYGKREPLPDLEEPATQWIPVPIPQEFRPPPIPVATPPPIRITEEEQTAELLKKQLEMQERALEYRKEKRNASDKALQKTLNLERRARTATREKSTTSLRSLIRSQLSRPSSARTAIALREVLDKPVGLR